MISARSEFDEACKHVNELNTDPFGVEVTEVSFREEEGGLRAVWPLLGSTGVEIKGSHDGLGLREWCRETTSGSKAPGELYGSWAGLGRSWEGKSEE